MNESKLLSFAASFFNAVKEKLPLPMTLPLINGTIAVAYRTSLV